jgi:aspartate carbamoyltransferase catalytic subunit
MSKTIGNHKNTRPAMPDGGLSRLHLDSIASLSDSDIIYLLTLAQYYAAALKAGEKIEKHLIGRTQINLFFETSTRTNSSFELAGKKLGADIIKLPIQSSSVQKGETLRDTVQTLAAMGADALIVRHREEGVIRFMAEALSEVGLPCAVINAGEGTKGHPTQALLDALTLLNHFGRTPQQGLKGLCMTICGDIRHSRVAASNAELMTRLGAELRFVGPKHMLPDQDFYPSIARGSGLEEGLAGADIVMALRIQLERMEDGPGLSNQDYFQSWGLSHQTMQYAKPGALIMHPGPINRGVEIDGALADDRNHSLILDQVAMGVPTRMAVLDAFLSE